MVIVVRVSFTRILFKAKDAIFELIHTYVGEGAAWKKVSIAATFTVHTIAAFVPQLILGSIRAKNKTKRLFLRNMQHIMIAYKLAQELGGTTLLPNKARVCATRRDHVSKLMTSHAQTPWFVIQGNLS